MPEAKLLSPERLKEITERRSQVGYLSSGLAFNYCKDIEALISDRRELVELARKLATELAYVHESPTLELAKSEHGRELLSDPNVIEILKEQG